ncbi:hypothetical protein [Agromyces neolithicus]|uniref:Tetratricopeptide repeat protein n=1 Tax=Agromyces neolithicus TaxID=269420 RepID=A0ABN2MBC3_9MICO
MATRITEADVDDLEFGSNGTNHHVERAELLERWATDTGSFELDDDLRRATLLLASAEHLEMAGELDRALDLVRRAGAASDVEPHETVGALVSILLARGERDAAIAASDALRASQSAAWWRYWDVAEAFELADELALAERWFVITLRAIERDPEYDVGDRLVALTGRHRVRRDAGKPEDVLDIETNELRGLLGYELAE